MSISTTHSTQASNLEAILSDLRVTKCESGFHISSALTRGKCANVLETPLGHDGLIVIPLLTKTSMAGIDDEAIRAAVKHFRQAEERSMKASRKFDFLRFRATNVELISHIAGQLVEISETAHWDLIDELKAAIDSYSANADNYGTASQQDFTPDTEAWIEDHCSTGLIEEDVSIALWLKGQEDGLTFLQEQAKAISLVRQRMDELTQLATQRASEAQDWFVSLHGGAGMAFLNQHELSELETLKQKLPSSGLLRIQAKARIAKRLADRKSMKS